MITHTLHSQSEISRIKLINSLENTIMQTASPRISRDKAEYICTMYDVRG